MQPDEEVVQTFERSGGEGKPKVGMVHVCWGRELALPEYFAAAAEGEPMLEEIRSYAEAGFTHAYVHQIGPDQQGFLDFACRELLPHVE